MNYTISMTDILLAVSVGCNLWFLFLLLYERIMDMRLVRFFKGIAGLWPIEIYFRNNNFRYRYLANSGISAIYRLGCYFHHTGLDTCYDPIFYGCYACIGTTPNNLLIISVYRRDTSYKGCVCSCL